MQRSAPVAHEELAVLRAQVDQFTRDREQLAGDLLQEKSIAAQLRKEMATKEAEAASFVQQYQAIVETTQQQLKQYEDNMAQLVSAQSAAMKASEAQLDDLERRVRFYIGTTVNRTLILLMQIQQEIEARVAAEAALAESHGSFKAANNRYNGALVALQMVITRLEYVPVRFISICCRLICRSTDACAGIERSH